MTPEIWLCLIVALFIIAFIGSQRDKKRLLKEYTTALKTKDKSNAIALGRKYYKLAMSKRDRSSIELTIMNDLKMAGIE